MSGEEWRPIPGLEFYEASSMGNIRSLDRTLELVGRWGHMTRFHAGRILKIKEKATLEGDGRTYAEIAKARARTKPAASSKPPAADKKPKRQAARAAR